MLWKHVFIVLIMQKMCLVCICFFLSDKVFTFFDNNSTFKFFNFLPMAHPFPQPHTF